MENAAGDKYVCPECGASVQRYRVEFSTVSDQGSSRIITVPAAPMCEHSDGQRWEMELQPVGAAR